MSSPLGTHDSEPSSAVPMVPVTASQDVSSALGPSGEHVDEEAPRVSLTLDESQVFIFPLPPVPESQVLNFGTPASSNNDPARDDAQSSTARIGWQIPAREMPMLSGREHDAVVCGPLL